ncbi:phytoene/squalene synthase family protein [Alkalihalobacillus pseudalcaliphilus]|uniref:phytoene/squalene synthase family protein n=1 Tax=Alkalihalobacillus pseudalcaliphilus TaxID=79884 RepID=UPI00064D73EB|nr:phytoene/squalene synthase family protein [Alkalihalobacillus pseudalcaliphilus]KMK77566.1 phytoene synthase [Alkalihalobacillus pseudalcaliphilus]
MLMKQTQQLKADYYFCEKIIRKHSQSFYYTFKQLPKDKARAVYVIYAFCRLADNTIDQNSDHQVKKMQLMNLREQLEAFERGEELSAPLWRALRDVFNRYEMDIQPFYDQLIGQEMDLDFSIPKDVEALETYSYYVAGTVGLMLLPIIATEHNHKLKQSAIQLGVAMQITNILRDVFEDVGKYQRIYLPSDLMETLQYSVQDAEGFIVNEAFIQIWEQLAQRAESNYVQFEDSLHLFDQDSQFQVLSAARVYRQILQVVRENQYQCFGKINAVSATQIGQIIRLTQIDIAN